MGFDGIRLLRVSKDLALRIHCRLSDGGAVISESVAKLGERPEGGGGGRVKSNGTS